MIVLAQLFEEHQAVVAASRDALVPALEAAVAVTVRALRADGRVLVAGNGGSAAQAQHFAAELCGRFERDRAPLSAIALTADTVLLTAVGNDLGFEEVFARQVSAHARAGDVLVLISTSGSSANIVAAARAGRAAGCTIVALTGATPSPLHDAADISLPVASTRTARIQEVHTICLHGWAAAVEDELA